MRKNTLLKDILINILAVSLPILILQLLSFPLIASIEGGEAYGTVVFIISIFTVIGFPIGNVLNNTRLLLNQKYVDNKEVGDFNLLLIYGVITGFIIFLLVDIFLLNHLNIRELLLILLIILLYIIREYYIVSFRLKLNFKGILYNNIFLSVGYFVGTLVYKMIGYWEIIYIMGFLFSNIYILLNTNLYKEEYKKTSFFKQNLKHNLTLYLANIIKNIISHADKLLLLPLLGPINVAIYYTATVIGKVASMAVTPANSVILSYLVKEDKKKDLSKYLYLTILTGTITYIIIMLIGPYFFEIFYPEWADKSNVILKYTAATAIISVLSSLLHPFNLRYNSIKWQVYLNLTYLIVYVVLTTILAHQYQLIGFSIAVLISNAVNLIMQLLIYKNKTIQEKG